MSIETTLNKEQIFELYETSGASDYYKSDFSEEKKIDICKKIRNFSFQSKYHNTPEVFSEINNIETPMLCFRFGNLNQEEKKNIWIDNNFLVDEKIDGERCLFFYDISFGIRLFSRENESTTLLPFEISSNIINEAFEEYLKYRKEITNFILDCELVRNDSSDTIYVFDCLYFNNKDIKQLPLLERKNITEKIVSLINYPVIRTTKFSIEKKFNFYENIINNNGEGVIFKNINSKYNIKGTRSKKNWIKAKGSIYEYSLIEDTLEGFVSSFKYKNNQNINNTNIELSCFIDNKEVSSPMTYININLFMISLFGSYYTINNYINNSSQLSLPVLEKELLGKVIEFKSSYFDLNNKCFKNVIPVKFRYDKNIYDCYYSSESLRRWSAI